MRATYRAAYINRLMKLLISNTIAKKIVSNSFDRAREKICGKAAWTVQRSFRGFLARNKDDRMTWIKQSIAAKENLRLHVSAKKVQKRLKGLIIRRRIHMLNKTAARIQSYFRGRWFRQVFLMIKKNTAVLQRGARRYLARRDIILQRTKDYLAQELQFLYNVREMENFQLFGEDGNPELLKSHTPYSMKKIFLFSRVADMHVITDLSEIHSTPWAAQYMKIYKDSIANEAPIMQVEVGATHSYAVTGKGRSFCWGWNDNGQCAKDPALVDEVIVKTSSKNAMILLDSDNFE